MRVLLGQKTIGLVWFGLALIGGDALAQSSPEVELAPIVISNRRLEQSIDEVPANITVLDQEAIDQSGASDIPDLLRRALGIHIVNNSTAKSSTIDIRGFGDTAARNVLVLVNGRKVNAIDISGSDLIQVPLESIEQVEIIRGAGSVLYGDNAVGGVVNLITKKGSGDLSVETEVTYGSYGTLGTDVQVQGERNSLGYFVFARQAEQGGYRANSDGNARDLQLRLNQAVTDLVDVEIQSGFHEDRQRLPGGLTAAQRESLGRRGTNTPNDFAETRDGFVAVSTDFRPVDGTFGSFRVDASYRNRDVYDEFNGFGSFHTKRESDVFGLGARYIFDRNLFSRDVGFVTGVDFYDTENDILGSGINVDDITIEKTELGAYASLEVELIDQLSLEGGTRYQQAEYEFNQRNVVVNESVRPDEWVNMVGLAYSYGDASRVHANVQQTFRFLATDEWYSTANFPGFGITPGLNTDLEQQTGVQYEVGWKHAWGDWGQSQVTPYWVETKDEIFFDPTTFANSNYDQTRRLGVELAQSLEVSQWIELPGVKRVTLDLNATLQDATFEGGSNDGNDIPHVPRQLLTQSISALFEHGWRWSMTGNYVGSRYAINDTGNQTSKEKPYYVLDTSVACARKGWGVEVGVNNMLNETYSQFVSKSTVSSTKNYFPAPERNYYVKVSAKF